MTIFRTLWIRFFGDKRVRYIGCRHCHGRGCVMFSLEELQSRKIPPVMTLNMQGILCACSASVYCSSYLDGERAASLALAKALRRGRK